jgi:hypothetical protein
MLKTPQSQRSNPRLAILCCLPLNVAGVNKRTPPGIAAAFIGDFGVPVTVYFPCRVSM